MEPSERSWKIFTIPNMISLFRLFLIAPIIYCVIQDERIYFYWAMGLIAVAIISDYVDGILARQLNQISEVGKILDPLADKIAVGALIIVLIIYKDFPLWAAGIIVGRDVLILLAGLIWASKYKFVQSSNMLGKWTVFFISLMIVAYIIDISILEKILTAVAVILTIISGMVYLQRFVRILQG